MGAVSPLIICQETQKTDLNQISNTYSFGADFTINIHIMYDIIPIVQKITIIDSKPIALPNIKSNQNAIS